MKKTSLLFLLPLLLSCSNDGFVRCEQIASSKGYSWLDREDKTYKIIKNTYTHYSVSTYVYFSRKTIDSGREVWSSWNYQSNETKEFTDKKLSSFIDSSLIYNNSIYVLDDGTLSESGGYYSAGTTEEIENVDSSAIIRHKTTKIITLHFKRKDYGTYVDCTNIFYNSKKAMIKIVEYSCKKKSGSDPKTLNGKQIFLTDGQYSISNQHFKFQYAENTTYYHVIGDETVEFVPYKK